MIKSGLTFGCEDTTFSIHCAESLKLVVQQATSLLATSASRLKYREMKYFAKGYTDLKPEVDRFCLPPAATLRKAGSAPCLGSTIVSVLLAEGWGESIPKW